MNYIFDGEIHALSEDYAYILKTIEEISEDSLISLHSTMEIIKLDFMEKYAEYLYRFDKDKFNKFTESKSNFSFWDHGDFNEEIQFIFTPPWILGSFHLGSFHQKSCIALKFKRSENDNLKYDINECDQ